MLSIERSAVFQNEYQSFVSRSKNIKDTEQCNRIQRLCESLLLQVKKLDKEHSELGFNNRLSTKSNDLKNEIANTRRLIDTLLKESNV